MALSKKGKLRGARYTCLHYMMVIHTENRFPLLVVKDLTKGEREVLIMQLSEQSEAIRSKFAVLVLKFEDSIPSNISANHFKIYFLSVGKEDLDRSIDHEDSITIVVYKIQKSGYWTYLDYELLEELIHCFCPAEECFCPAKDCIAALNKYIEYFKEYSKMRLYELPADDYKNGTIPVDQSILCLKLDKIFLDVAICDMKRIKYIVAKLWNIDLHLL